MNPHEAPKLVKFLVICIFYYFPKEPFLCFIRV